MTDYADGFVAPLEQNANNQTSPEERAEDKRQISDNKLERCWLANWQGTYEAVNKYVSLDPRSDPAKSSQENSVANCG